jgi:ATP-dependent Clp protease ATP-binding subunit ClpC
MSSDLPSRPSLEHLRKEAKERLRELQRRDPNAKLADAQHEIARAYGFLNWPQLKERVTAIERALPSPAPMTPETNSVFARFTDRAKRATFFSRVEAGQLGHPSIEPEHLLLGVVRARLGLTSRMLAGAGLSPDHIRSDVQARRETLAPLPNSVIIAFGPDTTRAIQLAVAEADRLRHDDIGTAHLLLGLMQGSTIAADILRASGLSLDAVRRDLDDLLNEGTL